MGRYSKSFLFNRFVLHYLNDYEVLQLFENIKSYHKGKILIIQFCNNDLKSKYKNSLNESLYENQLPLLKEFVSYIKSFLKLLVNIFILIFSIFCVVDIIEVIQANNPLYSYISIENNIFKIINKYNKIKKEPTKMN